MSNARFSILQARAVKDRNISDAQFRTLAALGMYADQDGWCFPMLSTLGNDLKKSKQAVGRDTIALRKLGYLEVHARYNENGGRKSSLYRLKFDLPMVNVDDSTPSTSGVDTPSTSKVDVNDPKNDQINSVSKKPKQDIIDYHLGLANFPGAKTQARIDSILSYLGETFRRNTETAEWKKFAKYIDSENRSKGWDVSVFVKWLISQDGYKPEFWPVKRMMEFYPSAFVVENTQTSARQIQTLGERDI